LVEQAAGAEAAADPVDERGGHGADVAGESSSGRGQSAGSRGGHDDIAELLCRDPLEPAQRECLLEKKTCSEASGPSWPGCAGACEVCEELLREFPYYTEWHPCCRVAPCGVENPRACDERCPPPATRDKVKPCLDD
jgi:hypothetical protein